MLRPPHRSAHHFCFDCYNEWVGRKPSCPTCRAPVWAITKDREFAKLIGAEITGGNNNGADTDGTSGKAEGDDEPALQQGGPRRVALPAPAGLTIANAPGGHGVIVTKVVKGNGGHVAGVRVGDVIIAVNSTAVRDHQTAVEFIERRCRVGDCELVLKGRRPSTAVRLFERAFVPRPSPLRPSVVARTAPVVGA